MTIHVLCNCYWGDGISGGDARVLELLNAWHGKIDNNKVIVYTTAGFLKLMKEKFGDIYEVVLTDKGDKKNLTLSYMGRTMECIKGLKKRFRKGDIVYSTTDILPDVIPASYIKSFFKSKCRWIVITYHIYEKFYKRPGNIFINFLSCYQQKYAIHLGKKRADSYLTTSPEVKKLLENSKKISAKVGLNSCAVRISDIDKSDCSLGKYEATFLARLNYSKGVMELPQIWNLVVKKYPEAKLAIMGKGTPEIEEKLREEIKKYNLESNIDLPGFVSSEEGWSTIRESGCFLFTSHEEGWGMSVAEALTAGTPVVAYRLPVFEDLFPKGTVYCDMLNIRQMADAVCDLINDKEKADRLGKSGSEYVRSHYSIEKMTETETGFILGE